MSRVVITGLGITSGIGNKTKNFADSLFKLKSGIGPIDTFNCSAYPVQIGSTVKNIESEISGPEKRFPRTTQFLLNAGTEALEQSGILDAVSPDRIGAYLAGPACAVFESENYYRNYLNKDSKKASRRDLLYINWDSAVNVFSQKYNLMGPRNSILTACSSSGVAIGLAYDLIRLGLVDAMVAGGTDGFSEFTFSGFHSLQSVSPFPCRPFDKKRAGLSFGEGAGLLVLEDYEFAKKRGANILAELVGYGAIGEGHNLTAPHPEAYGYLKTMQKAMTMGKVSPEQITYVNAHGTATPMNDVVEARAINKIFENYKVPVNSIKSLIGHCMGAAGAVEAVNCVLSITEKAIPGTQNFTELDPEMSINVIKETQSKTVDYVLCNSAGFGGNNSSVLFARFV